MVRLLHSFSIISEAEYQDAIAERNFRKKKAAISEYVNHGKNLSAPLFLKAEEGCNIYNANYDKNEPKVII